MRRSTLATLGPLAVALASCGGATELSIEEETSDLSVRRKDVYDPTYPVPKPELSHSGKTVDMPGVPKFQRLTSGPLTPRDVLRRRSALLGKSVEVRGTVIWRWDCVDARGRANVSRAQLRRHLLANEGDCKPGQLALAANRRDLEGQIWIVDAPHVIDKRVGDVITVTGRWTDELPSGGRHPGGALVFTKFR